MNEYFSNDKRNTEEEESLLLKRLIALKSMYSFYFTFLVYTSVVSLLLFFFNSLNQVLPKESKYIFVNTLVFLINLRLIPKYIFVNILVFLISLRMILYQLLFFAIIDNIPNEK